MATFCGPCKVTSVGGELNVVCLTTVALALHENIGVLTKNVVNSIVRISIQNRNWAPNIDNW